jgi:hypothetical protein
MKRLLTALPLLAVIAVASVGAVRQRDQLGATPRPAEAGPGLPVQMLPPGHPSIEQGLPALPYGHPPVPGYSNQCPGLQGGAEGNTDEFVVDAQELIST